MINNFKKSHWTPLFVVGSGRSGSTFFSTLLNGSEKIYFPYETSFIAKGYPFFERKKLKKDDYNRIAKFFRISSTAGGWEMSEKELTSALEKEQPQSFKEVNNVIYNYFLKKNDDENIKILGLRRPQMIAHMKRIKKVYPNAKFIHLIRDGRDVFLSYKNLHKTDPNPFGPKSLFLNALYWCDVVSRFKSNSDAIVIRYEDLIQNSDYTLEKIGLFLNIQNLASECQNYSEKKDKKAITNYQLDGINSKVYQGFDKKNTYKYKEKLNKTQIFIYEIISGYHLKKNKYELYFGNFFKFFLPFSLSLIYIFRMLNNIRFHIRELKTYHQTK